MLLSIAYLEKGRSRTTNYLKEGRCPCKWLCPYCMQLPVDINVDLHISPSHRKRDVSYDSKLMASCNPSSANHWSFCLFER